MIQRSPITPVPKPRMSQRDKWAQRACVLRYRAFCDQARAHRLELTPGCGVVFFLPIPKSWSKFRRFNENGAPHTQKPDLSNLLKALEDAVCPEDSHLWHYAHLSKRWAPRGGIMILSGSHLQVAMPELGGDFYTLENECPAQPT